VCDLGIEKAFLAHHVSKDLLEATERLAFERQPQPQVRAVCAKPFAELGMVDPFGAKDLYAYNDVMSFHRYAMNATQLTILLATQNQRTGQKDTSGDTEHE
jgi:hypothetical protein